MYPDFCDSVTFLDQHVWNTFENYLILEFCSVFIPEEIFNLLNQKGF